MIDVLAAFDYATPQTQRAGVSPGPRRVTLITRVILSSHLPHRHPHIVRHEPPPVGPGDNRPDRVNPRPRPEIVVPFARIPDAGVLDCGGILLPACGAKYLDDSRRPGEVYRLAAFDNMEDNLGALIAYPRPRHARHATRTVLSSVLVMAACASSVRLMDTVASILVMMAASASSRSRQTVKSPM